eukprot:scaffold35877_cov252-Amphora_coffeaeformis.AAC.1
MSLAMGKSTGKKHAAVHRASSLAHDSKELTMPSSVAEYVNKSEAMIEFQIMSLDSELRLLSEISSLPDDGKCAL